VSRFTARRMSKRAARQAGPVIHPSGCWQAVAPRSRLFGEPLSYTPMVRALASKRSTGSARFSKVKGGACTHVEW
jgi:hypothetical protein